MAKVVFEAMHEKGYHHARLIDATGKPKNKKNVAETEFEKKAVAEMKGGKTYVEEVGEKDGKPVFRAGTVVPAVLSQCARLPRGQGGPAARRHRLRGADQVTRRTPPHSRAPARKGRGSVVNPRPT